MMALSLVFITNKAMQVSPSLTSVGLLKVTFDHCSELWLVAEASVVKCIVTHVVDCFHISAGLQ